MTHSRLSLVLMVATIATFGYMGYADRIARNHNEKQIALRRLLSANQYYKALLSEAKPENDSTGVPSATAIDSSLKAIILETPPPLPKVSGLMEEGSPPPPVSRTMQVAVTIAVLLVGGYCVVSPKAKSSDKHFAYAAIGTIIGYWLR